ncbi:MAG: FAD-dependent oxidoreductase [Chlamydiota bacterium]|nr:FAD-dependent oxidoreductase [Chlamydiota bacterium]
MRIAILGAGFAGLATAWHILKNTPASSVTVIDKQGVGCGASGVSAGLLHPYTGVKAKKSKEGSECVASTELLLNEASEALGRPVFKKNGLVRLAASIDQEQHFQECAKLNSDVHWLNENSVQELVPGVTASTGIYIESAISVYPNLYMKGLWKACKRKGAIFLRKEVSSLQELNEFDLIICCLGSGFCNIAELSNLPLSLLKGQILELPWPNELPHLKTSVSSEVYMVMSENNNSCFVGSTFERNFTSAAANIEYASSIILPKLIKFYPALKDISAINCRAGIRITAPNREPLLKKVNHNCYVFSGLGSKGLLYHSITAERLLSILGFNVSLN